MTARVAASGRRTLRGTGTSMAIGECGRGDPGVEGVFIAPASDDKPLSAFVGGLQEFETFKAVLPIDRSRPSSKAMGEFVAGVSRDSDGVDANDRHGYESLPALAGRASQGSP
ncbi:hypothetical protein MCETE4_01524 [Acidimicrobiia bacterium]